MKLLSMLLVGFGLAVALLFMYSTPVLAQTSPDITGGLCAGANLDVNDPNCDSESDAVQKLNNLIRKVINLLSLVVGIVAVIMIIIGGLRYITSGGSDTGVTSAKNTILYAIIGLIIVALAQLLVRFVLRQVTSA
ncbi:MAG TPA: pilin [Candidatus Saccharimonadales bacterium]